MLSLVTWSYNDLLRIFILDPTIPDTNNLSKSKFAWKYPFLFNNNHFFVHNYKQLQLQVSFHYSNDLNKFKFSLK